MFNFEDTAERFRGSIFKDALNPDAISRDGFLFDPKNGFQDNGNWRRCLHARYSIYIYMIFMEIYVNVCIYIYM